MPTYPGRHRLSWRNALTAYRPGGRRVAPVVDAWLPQIAALAVVLAYGLWFAFHLTGAL